MVTVKDVDYSKYNKAVQFTFFKKMGKVINVVGLTIESAGPDAKLGDLCRIIPKNEESGETASAEILAEVVGFKDKRTLLMPYGVTDGIGLGSVVINTGYPLMVTASRQLLGKTLNALGEPTDGTEITGERYSVENAPPDPMRRAIIDSVLPLGVKAVDGMITLGKGQ